MEYVRRRKLRVQESRYDLHAHANLVSLPGRRGDICGTTVDRLIAQHRMNRPSPHRHHACACTPLIGSW